MRGPKPKYPIELTTEEEQELRKLASSHTAAHVKVIRARILLAAYDHAEWSNQQIAQEAGCVRRSVRKWRRRWSEKRSIEDLPRPGAPPAFFPLRCERRRRRWLAADHEKKAYPLRGGATLKSHGGWWHWGR